MNEKDCDIANAAYVKALKDGQQAAKQAGKLVQDNPYKAGTSEHLGWFNGFTMVVSLRK